MPNPLDDTPVTPTTTPVVPASTSPTATPTPSTETPASTTATSTPASTTPATPSSTPAAQPALTDDQISAVADKFLGKLTAAAKPTTSEQKAFELTPEFVESLKPVRVTSQMLAGLGFEGATPEQCQAFQTFADAIVTHAAHVSAFLQQRAIQEAESKFSPYVGYIEQQRAEANRRSFYDENKDLQRYEKFVSFAAGQVQPNKADGTPKSAAEVSKEVAEATRNLLKQAGVNLDSQNNANQGTASTGSAVPKMPTLATAGGSMSGSNQGKTGKSSIFED